MVHRLPKLLIILAAVTLLGVAGQAQGKGKGHNKGPYAGDPGVSVQGTIVFGARDREIIRDYYYRGNSGLPPGLAKRGGDLPPGLQKHLERNGTLPPGLQKKLSPFPVDLERRLPPLAAGYRRGIIGMSVVIIDRRTQRIMDVVHDLLRP
ncbi:MAG TPA: hypothetical protein VFU86_15355 [Terriglobales bacterium]|nr:hypothetical protein [Terriglobales bacterium]